MINEKKVDGEIVLLPYVEVNGTRTITDEKIRTMFLTMLWQNLVKKVFSDGSVTKGEEFLAIMKSPANYPVFVRIGNELYGFMWLNNVMDNHACAHICFLREIWGEKAVEAAKKILDYWFSFSIKDSKIFDVLIGYIPVTNQVAIRFAKSIGFVQVGEIPFLCFDAESKKNVSAMLTYKIREA